MSSRLDQLADRRAQLLVRSELQRQQLADCCRRFDRPLKLAESVGGFVRAIRRSPLFISALAFALMKTPWRKLARIPKLVWRCWKLLQFIRSSMK